MKTRRIFFLVLSSLLCLSIHAQSLTICGAVRDDRGAVIPNAKVSIKGTDRSVTTNNNGRYCITAEDYEIVMFGKYGCISQELSARGHRILDIVLLEGFESEPEQVVSTASEELGLGLETDVLISETKTTELVERPITSLASPQIRRDYNQSVDSYVEANDKLYPGVSNNEFILSTTDNLSSFSTNVNIESYARVKQAVAKGIMPARELIRTDGILNSFVYDYPVPYGKALIRLSSEIADCPWNRENKLARVGVRTKDIATNDKLPASNLVFLVNTASSMNSPDKIDIIRTSIRFLLDQMRSYDKLSIVGFGAGKHKLILDGMPANRREEILTTIENISLEGNAYAQGALQYAYETANRNAIIGGNNRIIICTDSNFDFGFTSDRDLENYVSKNIGQGIHFSIYSFGEKNAVNDKLEILGILGNGSYKHIENTCEAEIQLTREHGNIASLVAKQATIQAVFDTTMVKEYRLIGYESTSMASSKLDDLAKVGDIGMGSTITALYEIVPADGYYRQVYNLPVLFTVNMEYRDPETDTRKIVQAAVSSIDQNISSDFHFASAVAMYTQLMLKSKHRGDVDFSTVLKLARAAKGSDKNGSRQEFINLVESSSFLAR